MLCAHVLGMIIKAFGEDHVLWGTDSICGAAPVADRASAAYSAAELIDRFGYSRSPAGQGEDSARTERASSARREGAHEPIPKITSRN